MSAENQEKKLRDQIAMHALQGLPSSPSEMMNKDGSKIEQTPLNLAKLAYGFADAMMIERIE